MISDFSDNHLWVEAIDDPSFPPTQKSFHQYPIAGHIVSCAHEFGCSHRGAMPIRYGRQNCGPKRVLHEPQLRFVVRCSGILQVHPRLDQVLHFRTHHSDPSQLPKSHPSPLGKGTIRIRQRVLAIAQSFTLVWFGVWHPRASSSSVSNLQYCAYSETAMAMTVDIGAMSLPRSVK